MQKIKKIISLISATAIAVTSMASVAFAETESTISFDDIKVGTTGEAKLLDVINHGGWSGDDTFISVGDGILGKMEGDKSIKMNAYYEAFQQSHINMYIKDEADLSEDFYVTTQVYLPELSKGTMVRLGGEYYDGTSRKTSPCLFMGTDPYTKVRPNADNDGSNYYGWYEPNNWYTVVFAYSKADNKASWYIDGELYGSATITTSIKNLQWGARLENFNGAVTNLKTPNWAVVDDYAVVNGTYNPTDSDGDVTSSDSTIKVTKSKLAIKRISSGAERGNLGTQISVVDGTTVAQVEAALKATYGTDVYVADIEEIIDERDWSFAGDNADALKTIIPAQDAYISPSMKAVVVAKDGTLTFYHITVTSNGATLLSAASGSGYTLSGTELSGVKEKTTVAQLKANLVADGEMKLYSVAGYELKDATIIETGSVLRAYSASGNYWADYTVTVDGGSSDVETIVEIGTTLKDQADNTVLSQYTSGTLTAGSSALIGFAGRSGGNSGTNTYTKVTRNGVPAYKFESNYVFTRNTAPLYWEGVASATNTKKLQVAEFTIEPETNGRYLMYRKAVFSTGTSAIPDIQQYNPSLLLKDGKIYMGGQWAKEDNLIQIGTYENGKPYTIQWVAKEPEEGDKAIYIQGVYVNGEKIFPLGTEADKRNAFYDEETGYYVFANISGLSSSTTPSMVNSPELVEQYVTKTVSRFGSVYFGAAATSAETSAVAYYSGIKVYGVDEFPLADDETDEVSLDLTSDAYQVLEDAVLEGADVVKGYDGTVAEVLANLDSDIATTVAMLYDDGTTEVNPKATAKAGMIVRVSTLDGVNTKDYVLSDTFDPGIDESMHDTDNKVYYSSRTVQKYTNNEEKFMYVTACYDKDNNLVKVAVDTKTIDKIGAVTFETTLDCGIALAGGAKVKTMLLDAETLAPYISAYVYDEVNGGVYAGEVPATNY